MLQSSKNIIPFIFTVFCALPAQVQSSTLLCDAVPIQNFLLEQMIFLHQVQDRDNQLRMECHSQLQIQ